MKQKVVLILRLAVLICLLGGPLCLSAQAQSKGGITVTGVILDNEGLPVIGAGVTLKGTTTGVAAGMDGDFTITVPSEAAVIEVSALGYVPQEVKIGK